MLALPELVMICLPEEGSDDQDTILSLRLRFLQNSINAFSRDTTSVTPVPLLSRTRPAFVQSLSHSCFAEIG